MRSDVRWDAAGEDGPERHPIDDPMAEADDEAFDDDDGDDEDEEDENGENENEDE
jgi:hypothetical protein